MLVETARATRAEAAQLDAETLRDEADAAAEDATQIAEESLASLAESTLRVSELEQSLAHSAEQLEGAVAENKALEDELTRTNSALTVAVGERDAAMTLHAQTAALRETTQAELLASQVAVAALTIERDNAALDAIREKTHGEQRVTDLRMIFDEELDRLRADLDRARDDAREQRTRADLSESRKK